MNFLIENVNKAKLNNFQKYIFLEIQICLKIFGEK